MPFDVTVPALNAPLDPAPIRANFAALHALCVPVGAVIAWLKDFPGTPALPAEFAVCDGQLLNDPSSPFHGQALPDLNLSVPRFLRGGSASGATGGSDSFGTAQADNSGSGSAFTVVSPDFSPGATPFPPFYDVVWIMRVK